MSTIKGTKFTEEHKKNISKAMKGKGVGRSLSEATRQKMSKSHKGTKKPWVKGNFKKGYTPYNKGKKISENTKIKISKTLKKRWDKVGRKEYKRYKHFTSTYQYKKWRMAVFTRDNFTCVDCQKVGGYLEAHHNRSWAKYPKLRYDVHNGITLCKECHKLANKTQRENENFKRTRKKNCRNIWQRLHRNRYSCLP